MTWLNPAAWAGLLALTVPLVIHLLSRHRARTHRFPTLRFVTPSRLVPTRRTKLSDLWLLLVRAGIVVAAVAALAQPVPWPRQARSGARGVQRAIVLDTSASLGRATASGERAVDVARREAERLARESGNSLVIATGAPARVIDGASRWLELQAGRRELVVVSDFQRGVIDASDIGRIPAEIGVRFAPIAVAPESGTPIHVESRAGERAVRAQVGFTERQTTVEWLPASPARQQRGNRIAVLAGANEQPAATAALRAATTRAPADSSHEHAVAIVFAGYEGRATLLAESQAPSEVWMSDVLARLQHDEVLNAVAPMAEVVERAAVGTVAGRPHLTLFSTAPVGSLASAALIAAASNAVAPAGGVGEFEREVIDGATLRQWERPSRTDVARGGGDAQSSDGRWLWLVALGLIAAESWMRRPR